MQLGKRGFTVPRIVLSHGKEEVEPEQGWITDQNLGVGNQLSVFCNLSYKDFESKCGQPKINTIYVAREMLVLGLSVM